MVNNCGNNNGCIEHSLVDIKVMREALEDYIDAFTIKGKYVGNPKYLKMYDTIVCVMDYGKNNS